MNKKHIFIYKLLRPLVIIFLKFKFGYTFEVPKNLPEKYIVLSNHVTDYDPVLVASSFKNHMYFVASEHITRWKLGYWFLKNFLAPIIRWKGTVATNTVIDILRKVRKGHNVCVFAEGVRTWDGVTCPILPSTAKLIKSAGCGLVTYKLIGGHFVSPGWSEQGTRRGHLHGAPVNVYTAEQLAQMSVDEIYETINTDLYEDAYARQLADPKPYRGKNLAKGLENMIYLCPECGARGSFTSSGDTITCKDCGLTIRYNSYGMLEGTRFETVRDFAQWQNEQTLAHHQQGIVITAEASLSSIKNHEATFISSGTLQMDSRNLTCGDFCVALEDIAEMAIHGRHALVFTVKKSYYELILSPGCSIQQFLQYFEAFKKNS